MIERRQTNSRLLAGFESQQSQLQEQISWAKKKDKTKISLRRPVPFGEVHT